ncbi:MAG: FGGY family carbohydrate kinase [Chitinispirillaceae bacterium]|nr:FGGY family carbohydrate kinase [Chitinispirillaceae bacterium]
MSNGAYLLGYDVGSSSVKATLIEASTGRIVGSATSPNDTELDIISEKPGWAEQHPDTWWAHVLKATEQIRNTSNINFYDVAAIGISYQMHGLVMIDKNLQPLAPAIIWCDSRAVSVGEKAFKEIGKKKCLKYLLNTPGNFTASKLRWVIENKKKLYKSTYKILLPGDYIALKLTGEVNTTPSGLSEGIMWDFLNNRRADFLLEYYEINPDLIPNIVPTFGIQGIVTEEAANLLGVKKGIPVSYRAGDQPNNALSLNVLNPGEIAATAGTSGVVYGVTDIPSYDEAGRVNTFLHVNHTEKQKRMGILVCVNGTGILNRWLKNVLGNWSEKPLSYVEMDKEAAIAPPVADGLYVFPYGNGAERTLGNRYIGASVNGIDLTRHSRAHLLRAAQEGIVFALMRGIDIMRSMGLKSRVIRAGNANMFKSKLFAEVFATVANSAVELYNTDGSQGAARGAGIGAGIYKGFEEAFANLSVVSRIEPKKEWKKIYNEAYSKWNEECNKRLKELNK